MVVSTGGGCFFKMAEEGLFSLLSEVGGSVCVGDRGPPHCDINERTAETSVVRQLQGRRQRGEVKQGLAFQAGSSHTSGACVPEAWDCAIPLEVGVGVLTARARHGAGVRLSNAPSAALSQPCRQAA